MKKTPYKWLDFKAVLQKVLQSRNQILKIKYYTAIVSATSNDPDKPTRQNTFIRALENYIPEIEIYYGDFLTHPVKAARVTQNSSPQIVSVYKTEEKGSDVNLASHLINDAWLDRYDCGVVVSNDSDFAEAIRLIKEYHNKLIGIIFPFNKGRGSKELRQYADFVRTIRESTLKKCQLPNPIPNTNIYRPIKW